MKLSISLSVAIILGFNNTFLSTCSAFTISDSIRHRHHATTVASSLSMTATSASTDAKSTSSSSCTKKLSILTFDLDDTLYPVSTVLDEANAAFARSMKQFGYDGILPEDIVLTGKKIREEMAETDPERSAALTHTEIRRLAIREEMEKIEYQRKLQSCADDWATQVSSLSPLVVQNAKK